MKESKLYLNFFKRNFLIIVTPLIVLLISAWFLFSLSFEFSVSKLYESKKMDQENLLLIEQAISVIRTENLEKVLSEGQAKLDVYKKGPFLIEVKVTSSNKETALQITSNVEELISENYNLSQIGTDVQNYDYSNILENLLVISMGGFFVGLILALLKEYLKNY